MSPSSERPRRKGRPRGEGEVRCARCGDLGPASTTKYRLPEGLICGRCYDRAVHTHGICAGCHVERLLPGIDAEGGPLCADCAGINRDFRCKRCYRERAIFRAGLCELCALSDDLNQVLGHPTESHRSDLLQLRDHLLRADRPTSVLTWIRSAKVRSLLGALAEGQGPPDHAVLDALPQGGAVDHIRALLVEVGVLVPRDEAFTRFEAWVRKKVESFEGEHRRALERYAVWYHLHRIRQIQSNDRDVHSAAHNAKQQITAAANFLHWLQEQEITLDVCPQSLVDIWLTTGNSSRYTVRGFLQFARESRLAPPLHVPTRHARAQTRRITDSERLEWIGYYLTEESLSPAARSAALRSLVFGQPLTRIATMRLDAVHDDAVEGMRIRFAEDPVHVPEPFDGILRQHLASRARTRTGSVGSNPYLFPGARAGRHITREQLKVELNSLGVDVLAAKNTTLDELVAAMPAPMVADALGYSYTALGQHEQHRGVRYRSYVSGRYGD